MTEGFTISGYCYADVPPPSSAKPLYHVGRGRQTLLRTRQPRPHALHRRLAPGMIWFHVHDRWVFDREGRPLPGRPAKIYWIDARELEGTGARVTNNYFDCWADEERALLEVLQRMRELKVDTIDELLEADPDFLFWVSFREGVVTGRLWDQRAEGAELCARLRREGIEPEDLDWLDSAIRLNPTLRDRDITIRHCQEARRRGEGGLHGASAEPMDATDESEGSREEPESAESAGYRPLPGELMPSLRYQAYLRESFDLESCRYRTRAQLEARWKRTLEGWLTDNTDPFRLEQLEDYRRFEDYVLVPGPIRILSPQDA